MAESDKSVSENEAGSGTEPEPEITLQDKGDIGNILSSTEGRQQSLGGFDDEFVDIVDYIIRITHRIWEEKAIGLIYRYYKHNTVVHTSSGPIYGRDQVITNTVQALAALPDRRLYGDDVVWAGNDEDGFYTSHRLTHVGHNTGHSAYGPPTGRKVVYQAIADCVVKENRIVEEWLVRDEVSLIRQLGFDEREIAERVAARVAAREAEMGIDNHLSGEVERVVGQTTPKEMPAQTTEGFDVEYFVKRSFHEIWNWRLLNRVDAYYAENYQAHIASDREIYGLGDFKTFVLSMLSAFPDAAIHVDHFCALGNEDAGFRTATRWTLMGTHRGPGIYGEPTGRRIRVMGMSHHLVQNGKFVQEWTLFDEFALLKQLYAPAGESSATEVEANDTDPARGSGVGTRLG
ncbi:MAG: hypothetical protein MAG451_01071 [Anaerolineales bacterium]|nr:hypothetical protein [Anaerolineales bacterium]